MMYNGPMAEDLTLERDWDRMLEEPEVWYRIFSQYYLPLGPNRSLRDAFEYYLRQETPSDYKDVDPDSFKYIPAHWSEYSRKFEWARRATAYDTAKLPDVASLQVDAVLEYLRNQGLRAAHGLVAALESDRTRVQAANSILNRIGVPEVSEVISRNLISVNSDDMAAATEKVAEWKKTRQSG